VFDVTGKYNTAKVFTDNVESEAISQIVNLCNQEFVKDSKIRIMPDVHAGAGCTIGTTMTLTNTVVPNLVGVDIGCGMGVAILGKVKINLEQLDYFIRENIPSGHDTYDKEDEFMPLDNLRCKNRVNRSRALKSIGTLGGGNHFIEVNKDDEDVIYLVVHSGSRYLGKQIAEYYQDLAYKTLTSKRKDVTEIVNRMRAEGREKDIQEELKKVKAENKTNVPKELSYLEGKNMRDYLNDMNIAQKYARINRGTMIIKMLSFLGITSYYEIFETMHNYIDLHSMILRKGAVSATFGERLIIPMNMRDGSLICRGKGNPDWNESAPHGAGRLFSRSKAKELITLEQFKTSMGGIYTTSVCEGTIDESAFAYKPMNVIIRNVGDTVDIVKVIKPIYNFKSSS
jgi:RNA-splicing ligase RtcB